MVIVIEGDCLDVMKMFDNDMFDSIVTDPPAGISFMGKKWDHDKGGRNQWIAWMTTVATECLRVIKPGGHALVWVYSENEPLDCYSVGRCWVGMSR